MPKFIGENGAVFELQVPLTGAYELAQKQGRLTEVKEEKKTATKGRKSKDDSPSHGSN